eukprot:2125943-Rhodomonas_salina.1
MTSGCGEEKLRACVLSVCPASFHKYGDYFPHTGALQDCGARSPWTQRCWIHPSDGFDAILVHQSFASLGGI